MRHNESKLQISCVNWFRLQYPKLLLIAIPNGGKRNAFEAGILKKEGVLAGCPDIFIPVASKSFHGIFIEMKYGSGKLSNNQKNVIPELMKNGYCVQTCYSIDDFIKIINKYFENEK